MIDIHTHILPGIDDGARDIYDTLEMAQIAADSGVTNIVATPHCNIPGFFDNYFGEEYIRVFRYAQDAIKKEQIPVQLLPGMEVYATSELSELIEQKKIITLNGSRYLLVEFDFEEDPDYAGELLQQIAGKNLIPLIAHVERYRFVQENPQMIYEWRQKRYLIQVNKSSFQGSFGKHAQWTAFELLRHRLISVIASDAHGTQQRTPYMKDVFQMLREECPGKVLKVLFEENPRRICENRPTLRFSMEPFR